MIRNIYEALQKKENVRESLIQLKQLLKESDRRAEFAALTKGNYDFLMKLLVEDDPKVRKNAAGILGELRCQDALEILMDAYEEEETLFVKADYIKAMAQLDCREYLDVFQGHLQDLIHRQVPENEKKHTQAEIRELQHLLLAHGGYKKHVFSGYNRMNEVILTTMNAFYDVTAAQIRNAPVAKSGLGVRTKTANLESLMQIRTFKEVLFVIHVKNYLPAQPEQAAQMLAASDMMDTIIQNHSQGGPFCFRIGINGTMPLDQRSIFTKKMAAELETLTERKLMNTTSHYEVEIRLIQTKEGTFYPVLKFYTLADHRFDYRRYTISTGMQPYIAAGMLKLAEPYIKEHAQILDPLCGTGTFLIERNYQKPARDSYGIDIFGEAIEKARVNAKIANMHINYINRDFRDFKHEYLFDEIMTDMPQKGALTYEELDGIYQKFFERAEELLRAEGLILLYASEMGFVKKQLRLHEQFRLLKEYCISEKQKKYLFIIRLG